MPKIVKSDNDTFGILQKTQSVESQNCDLAIRKVKALKGAELKLSLIRGYDPSDLVIVDRRPDMELITLIVGNPTEFLEKMLRKKPEHAPDLMDIGPLDLS